MNAWIFVLAAALVVGVAFVLVAWPLLKRSRLESSGSNTPKTTAVTPKTTVESLRAPMAELEAGLSAGILTQEQFEEGKRALAQRLLEEVTRVPAAEEALVRQPLGAWRTPWLVAGVGAFIVVVSFGLYFVLGTPRSFSPETAGSTTQASGGKNAITPEQVERMVNQLVEKLKANPNDGQGWAMLARSYNVLGRFPEASKAYEKAVALLPQDAQLLADYADALAMTLNTKLEGEPMKLVQQALKIDPANGKALSLAATYAFDHKDYPTAIKLWERSLKTVAADSDAAQQLRANIAEAQQLAGGGANTVAQGAANAGPAATPDPGGGAAPAASSGPASVKGIVTLAPALANKASPEDTVFIFARAVEGPRMPVALLRKQVKDLPLEFTLDESNAMVPTATLAQFRSVVIGARVSKRGDAAPKSGDLEGFSKPVSVGSTGIAVQIDKVVP